MSLPKATTPWLAAFVLVAAPLQASGQRPVQDTTLAGIVQTVRGSGTAQVAMNILSQARGPESMDKLDALADSLVAIVVAYRPGDPLEVRRAAGAAGSSISWAGSHKSAVPYPRAFEALTRIYEESEDPGFRSVALRNMADLANPAPALPFLREVATSDDLLAHRPVRVLAQAMGPEGLSVVRALYDSAAVKQFFAREALEEIARAHGWR